MKVWLHFSRTVEISLQSSLCCSKIELLITDHKSATTLMTSPTATSASQLSICRKQQERQKTVKAIESVNIFGILEKYRDMIENMQRLNADKKSDDTKKISADDLEFGGNPESGV